MIGPSRPFAAFPLVLAMSAVGLTLACLLVGYEPVGADPDLLYRPLKSELARALAEGRLPFWSDRFGLGVPLVAESHVAAFYPANWLLYRVLSVAVAYRLAFWLHAMATALATYAYGRSLNLHPWGAALASVSFSLCGFSSAHSGHEPFYLAMPFLPLCLLASDRYVESCRPSWAALLALAWGTQLTIGHFQIPFWTGSLAMGLGLWRIVGEQRPPRRVVGLVLALVGGMAIASPQLALTGELARVAGFGRSTQMLSNYAFPPSHWVQPFLPELFVTPSGPSESAYWMPLETSSGESAFYVGTIPLILAIVGFVTKPGTPKLSPWRVMIAASLVLATMPRWWPFGFELATHFPGLGWFRCPGRYTLLTSLGLALLAGRGVDRAISLRRFNLGIGLAGALLLAARGWGWHLTNEPAFRGWIGPGPLAWRFGSAMAVWGIGLVLVIAWRAGKIAAWPLVIASAVELAILYHLGPVRWNWAGSFPEKSPIVRRLSEEKGVGLVAGMLDDLPVRAGLTTAYPYLGITPPPPNYLLESTRSPLLVNDPATSPWRRRFGVTHGVWRASELVAGTETIFESKDPALDHVLGLAPSATPANPWKIVRFPDPWPPIRAAPRVRIAADWRNLYPALLHETDRDEVWYLAEDAPDESAGPRASSARVRSWDGREAVVDHDGACDLVIRRTFYPGWTYRVDDALPENVRKADGGLQAARLEGSGTTRVVFSYRPSSLTPTLALSALATLAAIATLAISIARKLYPPGLPVHEERENRSIKEEGSRP